MFSNLEAEIARKRLHKKELGKTLGVRQATIYDKLNGKSKFTLKEALKIKNTYFPEMEIKYLFKKFND